MSFQDNHDNDDVFDELTAELDVERIDVEFEVAGEKIVGHVHTIEYTPTRSGDLMGVITLRTKTGALARVAAGAKSLRSQLEAKQVRLGDAVAIRYDGLKTPRNGGREYNSYTVAHRAVGDPKGDPFKVPDSLGLVPEALAGTDAWASDEKAPF